MKGDESIERPCHVCLRFSQGETPSPRNEVITSTNSQASLWLAGEAGWEEALIEVC